jgi:hypothetical protein
MFAGKARAYPNEATFRWSTLGQGPFPYPQTHKTSWKGLEGTNIQLFTDICKLQRKKFYNSGIWRQCYQSLTSVIYVFS